MIKITNCLIVVFIALTGCASVSGSSNQSISVLAVDSNGRSISEVTCNLVNSRGSWNLKTPATLTISRSGDPLKINCLKSGYQPGQASATSDVKGGTYGNVIVGGGLGAVVDHSTGASYQYPNMVQIEMKSELFLSSGSASIEDKSESKYKSINQKITPSDVYVFVIGNGAYEGSAKLINPANDAKAIASKFRSFGFSVSENVDTNREKLVTSLIEFGRNSKRARISILFYAGHGIQISGSNYLIPTDISMKDVSQVPLMGISIDALLDQYMNGNTKIVFLDACRDNPLSVSSSRSLLRGLAPIVASEGTLISYATKDGQVAQDGQGSNSPFTRALIDHISDNDDIAVVLRKVREKVMLETGGKQQPWEYGSLTGGALVLSRIGKD
jgi:hypothetical protein